MRLDIGGDGKIIGTRRVSPNGQVSGLSEFAGREVLVILPGSSESGATPPWPTPEGITQAVGEQIRAAYERTRALQEMYATPWEATRSFLKNTFGAEVPDLLAEVDRWVKSQVQVGNAGRTSPTNGPAAEETPRTTRNGSRSPPRRKDPSGRKRP